MKQLSKLLTLTLGISFISVLIIFVFVWDQQTLDIILGMKMEYIFAALLLHLLSFVVWGLRTSSMSKALGYNVKFIDSLEIVSSSVFLASITPSSAGGEPLRVHLLSKRYMPLGKATSVVVTERLLDAIVILIAAPIAVYFLRGRMNNPGIDILLLAGVVTILGVILLLMYSVKRPGKLVNIIHMFSGLFVRITGKSELVKNLPQRVEKEIGHFNECSYTFINEGRSGLFYGMLLTVLFWVLEFSLIPVLLLGLGSQPFFLYAFATQVLLFILLIVPATPGSSGIAEFGATTLFSTFVPAYMLGVLVIIWRAFTFYINLLIGGLVSFKILHDSDLMGEILNRQ
ncbi:flippase-like domain-containing protein [Methanolobus sp. ZRKC2]|uniref:lysylphosphatidylglycerol synthase transmembrane domain-containing protein n=1 Tax=Methanolobus sp. ZRKC2 TaxID=3125783 RepID=UPI0032538C4E